MHSDPDIRSSSVGHVVFAFLMIGLSVYLTFAALQGEYGLFRLFQIEAQETRLRSELADLQKKRIAIERKTQGLAEESLDPDLLDEQARKVLGLGRADEILIP